jgi:hypothetical protein
MLNPPFGLPAVNVVPEVPRVKVLRSRQQAGGVRARRIDVALTPGRRSP